MKSRVSKWLCASAMMLGFGTGCNSCSTAEPCLDEEGNEVLCIQPDMAPDLNEPIDMPQPDEGMAMVEPDAAPDLSRPDADMTPVDMCQPMDQAAACNNVCGMQPDGCGGMVDCGEPLTQAEACTGTCGMQSNGCGGMIACEPCACENGQPLEPRCGVCQLGRSACDGDTFSCEEYEIPGLTQASDCEADIIYVNARSMADTPDGSINAPFTTLADATMTAGERGAKAILVGGGSTDKYAETLTVLDGTSVHGGWSVDWLPDSTRTPIIEPTKGPEPSDLFGAQAIDIVDRDTLVAYLQIKTPDIDPSTDGPGFNNYGFYARNAQTLRIEHISVEAGRGGNGARGEDGVKGDDGWDGQDGGKGLYSIDRVIVYYPMGFLIANRPTFGGTPLNNDGFFYSGFFDNNPSSPTQQCNTMSSGIAARGGYGGRAGNSGIFFDNTNIDGGENSEGLLGGQADGGNAFQRNGRNGTELVEATADTGSGGQALYSVQNDVIVSGESTRGDRGEIGDVGNGGSGGAGQPAQSSLLLRLEYCGASTALISGDILCNNMAVESADIHAPGPSGGFGGLGGCGGNGGEGGYGGGTSSGLFLIDASVVISDSAFFAGGGGSGGEGGSGGLGGAGGTGGRGTDRICRGANTNVCQTISDVYSGDGGDGSRGQNGGDGGGGAGGGSFGAFCENASLQVISTTIKAGVEGIGGTNGETGMKDDIFDCE